MDLPYRARAFGIDWRSDIPLPGFDDATDVASDRPVVVRRVADFDPPPSARPGARAVNRGTVFDTGIAIGWGGEVDFVMTGGDRIDYRPGPDWTGAIPATFYSTVAALTAAWRGLLPLHACAVELDGRAVLIAGAGGAGKSTLAADLLAAGAPLIADDLVVVRVDPARVGARDRVLRGRPTIRLHPATAAVLDTIDAWPVPEDPRGKWLARPRARSTADAVAPAAILILGDGHGDGPAPAQGAMLRLFPHLFRPTWLDALPMRADLMRDLLRLSMRVPVMGFPAQAATDPDSRRARAQAVIARLRG
ncbi:hypothetical protein ASE86_14665 [Sphingomonas sp. Leaf33]|uniref:hypothetical protein n=1 Tax=Sphingomonas sp. Leaf33 TaxID=1736215 RepID=UPI0006FBEFC8|nr:hypothetical protein [Sphingomonas sp. Leaf33]KQN21214.1 hypothetical protein ASE86_14665 [Sphingomonas sp. Leaf33]